MPSQVPMEPTLGKAKSISSHPLAPLSASELKAAAEIIKVQWPNVELHFKVVTLQEPPKSEVLKYLEAEHSGQPLPVISRKAFLNYYLRNTVSAVVWFRMQ